MTFVGKSIFLLVQTGMHDLSTTTIIDQLTFETFNAITIRQITTSGALDADSH